MIKNWFFFLHEHSNIPELTSSKLWIQKCPKIKDLNYHTLSLKIIYAQATGYFPKRMLGTKRTFYKIVSESRRAL